MRSGGEKREKGGKKEGWGCAGKRLRAERVDYTRIARYRKVAAIESMSHLCVGVSMVMRLSAPALLQIIYIRRPCK